MIVLQSNTHNCVQKVRWQYVLLFIALVPAVLVMSSCGGGTTAAAPTISVYCEAGSVNLGGTVQCIGTIENLSSTLVVWQVNGVTSGSTEYGAIDTNGLYTAPTTAAGVPTNNVVTITAEAQAQTTLTATATITILPAAVISGITCLNPLTEQSSQTVAAGGNLVCTPTVAGGGNVAVYWYVNNSPTCSSTLGPLNGTVPVNGVNTWPYGEMTNEGNFIPPPIPPPGGWSLSVLFRRSQVPKSFACR